MKDQLRQIQGCTGLNMRFRTVKVRITFYNIFKKTPKWGCFFDCTELVEGDGEGGRLPGCPFDFHSAVVLAGVVPPLHQLLVGDFSTPPVHPSFTQNSIFFNPVAFSCLNDKWVTTPDFLKRQEVEVGQVVAWQVACCCLGPFKGYPVQCRLMTCLD